jgi:hypothetical protein
MANFKFILILCLLVFTFNSKAQKIKLKKQKYNFGFVHEGEIVSMKFELTNVGSEPLIITDYKVECGCTVMEKPKNAILPNEHYSLLVTFDTHEKYDRQDRTVTVISNATNSPTIIRFKGVVLKKKK